MADRQNIFDFSRFRIARSFSSEDALDLEFTEKSLHYPIVEVFTYFGEITYLEQNLDAHYEAKCA